MRCLFLHLMAVGLLALPAHAQQKKPSDVAATVTVTILTDAIVEPNSRAAKAINELAERPGDTGNIRVLPIAGHGSLANMRDLLHLRGVDFAILNSDALAFADLTRQHPDARLKVRYVTHLFEQKVFLLARKEVGSVEDLRKRKVLVLSKGGSHTTAATLLGLLKVDAKIEALPAGAVLDDAALSGFDGVLLLSDDLARVRLGASERQGLRALPLPLSPPLRGTYQPAVIEPRELPGVSESGNVETVVVSTLLAVYNWTPSQGRFATVSSFMTGFFAALPKLRQNKQSVWRQADINAQVAGWTRHSAAQPGRVLAKPQLAELATVERPLAALAPLAQAPQAAAPQKSKVRIVAFARPPLADERLPDGGLVPALVNGSLSKVGIGPALGLETELRWTKSGAAPVSALVGDSSIDISMPWDGADCERPNDLVRESAVLCDNALYSEPILQVVVGLFTLSDSAFTFASDESILGKTICIPQDQDVSAFNDQGRNWLSEKRVVAVRHPTILDCAGAVQRKEADAFVANDLEGRYVLDRLGLGPYFKMAERPLSTRGVHAIVSRENARASDLIGSLNRGLKQMKQTDAYAAIVRKHLMQLWAGKTP